MIFPNNGDNFNIMKDDSGNCIICLQGGLEFGVSKDHEGTLELSHGGTLQVSGVRNRKQSTYIHFSIVITIRSF